ncbi:MAG: C39 family peptidase [Chloroflexi bacterium]|nr:C39 family peptidase [Chloroflexota bacterium]
MRFPGLAVGLLLALFLPAPALAQTAAAVQLQPNPATARLGPLMWIGQTLNNCGPASVAEALDYFGVHRTQSQIAMVLRPNLPAYGMSLFGVPFYAESVGMASVGGVGGTDDMLRTFIANGIPVIVADQVSASDGTRHFRPIDGYDDVAQYFIGSDPYLGPNHRIGYTEFDQIWQISLNRWVTIYPPDKQPLVDAILAQTWNATQAEQGALDASQTRIVKAPKMPWGYMDLADAQIHLGDLAGAADNVAKASSLGLPFEAHWLQLAIDRASAAAAG